MRKGFTLAEALVATTLLLLILTSLALLVRSYSGSSRASNVHDSSMSGARLALEGVRRDAEAAFQLITPVLRSNTAGSTLRLLRPDPEFARLPQDFPSSPPAFWDPYDPAGVVEVQYLPQGQALLRQVTFSDGTVRRTLVAEPLGGFSVTSLSDDTLVVRCSVITLQGAPQPISARIALRCLDRR